MEEREQWAREEEKQTRREEQEEEEGHKIEGEAGGGVGWQWGALCSVSSGQGGLETMPRRGEDDAPRNTRDFGSAWGTQGR
jgi:hypothetical protein